MKAVIRGIGITGGFGFGINALEKALKKRESGESIISVSGPGGESIDTPAFRADISALETFADRRALRRIDYHTRMALLACFSALDDAGLSPEADCDAVGIAVGTGYGSTCNTFELEGFGVDNDILRFSPIQFSNSVHNAAGAHIANFIKSHGPNLTINQFDLSFPAALATACQWLEEERAEQVLVGGADDYARIMAWHRHVMLSASDAPVYLPPVGEGSVFFLLDRDTDRPSPYGCIYDASVHNGVSSSEALTPVSFSNVDCSDAALTIISADGFSPNENRYAECVGEKTAVYAPLYGHLPIGMGFDVAAASLTLKTGTLFASSKNADAIIGLPPLVQNHQVFDGGKICCLKLGQTGGMGWAVVGR